ncbi:MAG: GNAT family N-acetyltransferase [Bacteroidota bacterium]
MNGIEIKIATRENANEIAELGKVAFRHFFENENNRTELLEYLNTAFSREHILTEFEALNNVFLLAVKDNQLQGFARLWEDKNHYAPDDSLKMERLYIWPELVGSGLGALLMQSSIDFTAQNKYVNLWLQVLRPNERAVSFYRKWGFEYFHESPGKFEGDNEIDYWMKRSV